jgi:hypothetical protein
MANYTLKFNPLFNPNGWTSFFTFYPDWMTSMNGYLYSFKSGELYKHNTNATRNQWYGATPDPSKMVTIFNDSAMDVKLFKTLDLEATHPWLTNIVTDMSSGRMESSYYDEKEGGWFTYIRRLDNTVDYKALSNQGIGSIATVAVVGPQLTVTFNTARPSSVAVGDLLYYVPGSGTPTNAGTITAINTLSATSFSIVVATVLSTPSATQFAFAVKNSVAESYGARGYYMEVELISSQTVFTELFFIGSEVFKSYP